MNECLIDFDPDPKCPAIGYDADWDDSPWFDFDEVYDYAKRVRLNRFVQEMRTRVLTKEEEDYAHSLGQDLIGFPDWRSGSEERYRYSRELNDLWFQQRRLQALARGVLLP